MYNLFIFLYYGGVIYMRDDHIQCIGMIDEDTSTIHMAVCSTQGDEEHLLRHVFDIIKDATKAYGAKVYSPNEILKILIPAGINYVLIALKFQSPLDLKRFIENCLTIQGEIML